jgi:hypothetical protein
MKTSMKTLFCLAFTAFCLLAAQTASAQFTTPDSVCAGTQDVVYGIVGANGTSTYSWSLSNPSSGTIDNSIATNDSVIQIDWGTTPGVYTLRVVETSATGCLGDTVTLDVTVRALPTIAIVGDSVCQGDMASLAVTLTGQAPWTIDYTDGTNNFSETANTANYVINAGGYTTTQTITITGVTDGYACAATGTLPDATLFVYPKPATGAIFHY